MDKEQTRGRIFTYSGVDAMTAVVVVIIGAPVDQLDNVVNLNLRGGVPLVAVSTVSTPRPGDRTAETSSTPGPPKKGLAACAVTPHVAIVSETMGSAPRVPGLSHRLTPSL